MRDLADCRQVLITLFLLSQVTLEPQQSLELLQAAPAARQLFAGAAVSGEGALVGAFVGTLVGVLVGRGNGAAVIVGPLVGALVGFFVGALDGALVGFFVGALVGFLVGALVGFFVGAFVGFVGALVGDLVGDLVGFLVGALVGIGEERPTPTADHAAWTEATYGPAWRTVHWRISRKLDMGVKQAVLAR